MKNVLTILIIILVLVFAGGAIYYFFFMPKTDDSEPSTSTDGTEQTTYTVDTSDQATECPANLVCLGGTEVARAPKVTLGKNEVYAKEEEEQIAEEEVAEEEETPADDTETQPPTTTEIKNNTPLNVLMTNKDFQTWSIAWVTKEAQKGYVKYGTDATNLDKTVYDDREIGTSNLRERFTHHVTITNTQTDLAQTDPTFYFKIVSGEEEFDNNGQAYSYQNVPLTASPSTPNSAAVTTSRLSGYEGDDYIVVVRLFDSSDNKSTEVSTAFEDTTGVEVPIGVARTVNLNAYFYSSNLDYLEAKLYGPDGNTGYAASVSLSELEGNILNIPLTETGYEEEVFSSSAGSSFSLDTGASDSGDDTDTEDEPTGELPETGLIDSPVFVAIFGFVIILLGVCMCMLFIPFNWQGAWERKVVEMIEKEK